jgi:hemolysin activation/secretion protein
MSVVACVFALVAIGQAADAAAAASATAAADIGQQVRDVEKGVEPATPGSDEGGWFSRMFRRKSKAADTNVTVSVPEPEKAPKAAAPVQTDPNAITQLNITGDVALIERGGLKARLEAKVVGKTISAADLAAVAKEAEESLRKDGYLLAVVTATAGSPAKGVAELNVKSPMFGKKVFSRLVEKEGVKSREPYVGRYFSEESISKNFLGAKEGDYFCYPLLARDLFQINSKPDLKLDTRLVSRAADGRQYADMNFTVRESLPLHAMVEINNTGTDETGDWRLGATVQHLNLTKHDDVLTVRFLGSPEVGWPNFTRMWSAAGSYSLPYTLGNGGMVTVLGGYASVDSEDIAPEISMKGGGPFGGIQGTYRLINSANNQFSVGLGAVYRDLTDKVVLSGRNLESRNVTVVPFSLILSYASARPDGLGGRTFATSETIYNMGDAFGVTEEDEVDDQRTGAEPAYLVERLQLARLQPLFGRLDEKGIRRGQWTLFVKAQGQIADGAIIPAEGIGVGGMNTVRGYDERSLLGDHGVSGTIELRTPLFSGVLGRMCSRSSAGETASASSSVFDRTQFLVFADGGYISRSEALDGEISEDSIYSAGLGLRMSFKESAQIRVDAAYRLSEVWTGETRAQDNGVGWHFAAQWQF